MRRNESGPLGIPRDKHMGAMGSRTEEVSIFEMLAHDGLHARAMAARVVVDAQAGRNQASNSVEHEMLLRVLRVTIAATRTGSPDSPGDFATSSVSSVRPLQDQKPGYQHSDQQVATLR